MLVFKYYDSTSNAIKLSGVVFFCFKYYFTKCL